MLNKGRENMQILLIRHGESEADILHVHEGRADFELTDKGRQQVQRLVQKVKDFAPDFIWASTLKRARETGETLAEAIGCPIQLEEELMEFNNEYKQAYHLKKQRNIQSQSFFMIVLKTGNRLLSFE